MATKTHLYTDEISYTAETSEAASLPINFSMYSTGTIKLPAADTYTFYGNTSPSGTFVAAYSSAGTPAAITIVAAGAGIFSLPDDLKRFCHLKITAAAPGAVAHHRSQRAWNGFEAHLEVTCGR